MDIERIKNFYQKYKLEILFGISTFIIACLNTVLFSKIFTLFIIIGIFAFLIFILNLIFFGIYGLYEKYKENKNKKILDQLKIDKEES